VLPPPLPLRIVGAGCLVLGEAAFPRRRGRR
jgi:hypothetical protein